MYDVCMYVAQTFVELQRLELESNRGLILNPIVGPEPITGTHTYYYQTHLALVFLLYALSPL